MPKGEESCDTDQSATSLPRDHENLTLLLLPKPPSLVHDDLIQSTNYIWGFSIANLLPHKLLKDERCSSSTMILFGSLKDI